MGTIDGCVLALAVLLTLGQARVQPIPPCAEKPLRAYAQVGRWFELGGSTRAVSAEPAIAKVRVTRGHAEVMGVQPGWVDVTLTDKDQVRTVQVCVGSGEPGPSHCDLCDLPMSVQFSKPIALVGPYPDLAAWRLVRAAVARTGVAAPPTPPELVPNVLAAANQALENAGLPSRLKIVSGLPVLDPMPRSTRDDELATAALGAHLPILLELLAP
jgi:hypothetical protein